MGNSTSVLDSVTSFADINDIQKALQATPDPTDEEVIKAFHACCYVSTTCQRLQCILELFLKHGIDVNVRDPATQWTILHHAFASQKTFVLPYLLAAGAKPNRDINGLAPIDYLAKTKYDHFVRAYLAQFPNNAVDNEHTKNCEIQILHDWKRDTHELGELLHVKCKGSAGYVQLIYHENDSVEAMQDEAVFDQFINVEEGERTISFSTSHLPELAVVHVLYVACNKQMLHRRVQATDGPIWMKANVEKYVFTVNGEAFHHANPILDGMVFPTMREFQQFMKMMKTDKLQGEAYVEEPANNQDDEDSAAVHDDKLNNGNQEEIPASHEEKLEPDTVQARAFSLPQTSSNQVETA
ncbi:hypothetical protein AeMF1_000627 [Aphanomyces euteiches]|nr:hypothetical protein AeMF1_000627 [Aphanomyces euteiches]